MVCDRVVVGGGGRTEEEEEARDTESKTRTPHKVVGKNHGFFFKLYFRQQKIGIGRGYETP